MNEVPCPKFVVEAVDGSVRKDVESSFFGVM